MSLSGFTAGLRLDQLHEGFGAQPEHDLCTAFSFALALMCLRASMSPGGLIGITQGLDSISSAAPSFGLPLKRFLSIHAGSDQEALWSAEEVLGAPGVAGLIVEVCRFDLLASRRLQLRLEQLAATSQSLPPLVFVLRVPRYGKPAPASPSASGTRWRIAPLPASAWISSPWVWRWDLELFRHKGGSPSHLQLEWCYATHAFSVLA